MRKIIVLLICCLGCTSVFAQQLKTGEYYFDTDPGTGNATAFTFVQADSISMPLTVPTGTLTTGFHKLYTRVKNTNNVWGPSSETLFYIYPTSPPVTAPPSAQLKRGEYYFDTDPGVGNGTAYTFPQADSINMPLSIPTGTLTVGFHKLYTRVLSSDNKWGISSENLFYVYSPLAPPVPAGAAQVAAMEYFFDDLDYGPGQCAYLNPFIPADSVLVNGSVTAEDPLFLTPLPVGTHKLNIRAKDLAGKWSLTKSVAFTVCDQPATASFTQSVSGTTVTFTNTSANSFGAQWIFGDGTTSTQVNPVHTYNNGGMLNVGLISYSGCGNDTAWNTITLNCVNPTAAFTSSATDLTVGFTNTTAGAATYSWNFGDTRTSTDANPVHVFQSSGTYTVCLTTTNGCGSTSVCHTITVTCVPPVAGYSVNINGYTATITNTSTNVYNFVWNFGDATTNNIDYHPVKQYSAAGTYLLKLTVNNGCGANIYQSNITIACAAPTATFNTYTDGLGVELENNSLNGTSWAWDFGDGTSSAFKNPPIHTFPSTGTYTITLTVTNSCGSNTYVQVVSVCTSPVAQYNYVPSGTTVNFTNISSNAASYVWNFGDGLITNLSSPAHTYAAAGNYNVCLTATNACGTNQSCSNINVLCTALPQPAICMVSVDSGAVAASSFNMIFWDKSGYTGIDSFYIYREITTGVYLKIAAVDYDALSEYHDLTANPNANSFRYKISLLDTCGNESVKSDYHETIHLQYLGSGNLQWNLYDIENFGSNPVDFYDILRDDNSTGNFQPIAQISGNASTYTDVNAASFPNAHYRVKSTWSLSCTPTLRLGNGNNQIMGAINTSRSNVKSPSSVGIKEKSAGTDVRIYPNPVETALIIESSLNKNEEMYIEMENTLGQCVYKASVKAFIYTIDVNTLEAGVYLIKVHTGRTLHTEKIIIQ